MIDCRCSVDRDSISAISASVSNMALLCTRSAVARLADGMTRAARYALDVTDVQNQPGRPVGDGGSSAAASTEDGAGSRDDGRSGAEPAAASHADLPGIRAGIEKGGAPKYHKAAEAAGKMFAR